MQAYACARIDPCRRSPGSLAEPWPDARGVDLSVPDLPELTAQTTARHARKRACSRAGRSIGRIRARWLDRRKSRVTLMLSVRPGAGCRQSSLSILQPASCLHCSTQGTPGRRAVLRSSRLRVDFGDDMVLHRSIPLSAAIAAVVGITCPDRRRAELTNRPGRRSSRLRDRTETGASGVGGHRRPLARIAMPQ